MKPQLGLWMMIVSKTLNAPHGLKGEVIHLNGKIITVEWHNKDGTTYTQDTTKSKWKGWWARGEVRCNGLQRAIQKAKEAS